MMPGRFVRLLSCAALAVAAFPAVAQEAVPAASVVEDVSRTEEAPVSNFKIEGPVFAALREGEALTVSRQPSSSGGTGALLWFASGCPSWIEVDPETGAVSGTAAAAGEFAFKLFVKDASEQTKFVDVTITVHQRAVPAEKLVLAAPVLGHAPAPGIPLDIATQPAASGGTGDMTWSLDGAPEWLVVNTATGEISGTAAGTALSGKLKVQDEAGQSAEFDLGSLKVN